MHCVRPELLYSSSPLDLCTDVTVSLRPFLTFQFRIATPHLQLSAQHLLRLNSYIEYKVIRSLYISGRCTRTWCQWLPLGRTTGGSRVRWKFILFSLFFFDENTNFFLFFFLRSILAILSLSNIISPFSVSSFHITLRISFMALITFCNCFMYLVICCLSPSQKYEFHEGRNPVNLDTTSFPETITCLLN